MIPENCRLDIYMDNFRPTAEESVSEILASPTDLNWTLIACGLALNYTNFMIAADPALVAAWKPQLKQIPGVYVNEYPPEIQAKIDAEEAVEGWA